MGDIREFGAHLLALRREMQRIRHRRLSPTGRAGDVDHFGADDDIECLAASKYYFDWVLEEFEPYLRGRVLEVGAGTGTITRKPNLFSSVLAHMPIILPLATEVTPPQRMQSEAQVRPGKLA